MRIRRRGVSSGATAAVLAVVLFAAGASYLYLTGVTPEPASTMTEPTTTSTYETTTESTTGGETSRSTSATTTYLTSAVTTVQDALALTINQEYYVNLNGTHYLYLINATVTNANSWNMSVPWAVSYSSPGNYVIDYYYDQPTAYPYCWNEDAWGGFSVVTEGGAGTCARTLATLSNVSAVQPSATFNEYKELRPGQSLVQLLGFITASQDAPSVLQYSCAPRVDPITGSAITCVNLDELYSPGTSCGSGWWGVNRTCGPAFSASTADLPAEPIPISVVNASRYEAAVTYPSGHQGTYATTPDVPWLSSDLTDAELAPSIDQVGGCSTACSYVHAGQAVEDFTVVVSSQTLFKVDSVQGANPDFVVTHQALWTESGCTAGAARWHFTFVIPQALYGSLDSPYEIQFAANLNFDCP